MFGLLTLLTLACFLVCLGLFVFIMRFAVRTEVTVTTALLSLIISAGLFAWAMLSVAGKSHLWEELAYMCALLMFPVLIILFVQRSGSDYFLLRTDKGRVIVFGPLLAQLAVHYALSEDVQRFTDFVFLLVWILISFVVWKRLYASMRKSSSGIRREQLEFMLMSFFAVLLFNIVMLFGLFVSGTGDYGALFSMAIAGSMVMTVRGLVRYQMVIGKELLVRNSLIAMLTSVICVGSFVIAQMIVLSSTGSIDASLQIAVSTAMVIVIVLSINLIGDMSARLVEWFSPQLKWQESLVREVYIMHSSGLVIAHAGAHDEFGEIDRDMVGGMLTAIQNFVQEAFHASEMDSLKSLSMGKLRVLIEARGSVVVAVIFTGPGARELRRGVVSLLEDLDRKFGPILADWKGEKRLVAPIQDWLEKRFEDMAGKR